MHSNENEMKVVFLGGILKHGRMPEIPMSKFMINKVRIIGFEFLGVLVFL